MQWYLKLFGTTSFYKFHEALHRFSSRTIGVGNYDWQTSGEQFFLKNVLPKKNEMVIFDVGALYGEYSEMAKKFHPNAQVYAFEPQPKAFIHLQKKAKDLGFQAFSFGMGDQEGDKELFFPVDSPYGSAIATLIPEVLDAHFKVNKSSEKISLQTIDQFCKRKNILDIDLLKIDAEGFEYEILQGATEMISTFRINLIQIEINVMNVFRRKLLRDFMDLLPFYSFFRLLPKGMVLINRSQIAEVIDFQNVIAWRSDLYKELEQLPKNICRF